MLDLVILTGESSPASTSIETAIQGVVNDLSSSVTTIIPIAMAVGGVILIATVGWRLIKRFVK